MAGQDRERRRRRTHLPAASEEHDASAPLEQPTLQRAVRTPQQLSAADVRSLQQSVGNTAVAQLLRAPAAPAPAPTPTPTPKKAGKASSEEDRAALIMLWQQVEMDVGNSNDTDEIHASFLRNAQAMQRSAKLYPAVQQMYDMADDLIDMYVAGHDPEHMADLAGF